MDLRGLSGICSTLGVAEEDENGDRIGYSPSDTCSENLRDLLRFLRRDDPQTRDVFKQVCKWKTVSKDLIPIIYYCQNDRSLVLNAVKVLVFLTMPIELSSSDIPQQIEYLWDLKSAITNSEMIVVVVSLLETPLENLERESFTEDDWKLVQLVLTFFRNVLAIQDISLSQKVGCSASELLSLRDRFIELLFHENVMDLVIVLTQHVGGSYSYLRQDNLLLLEIFYYILMGQDPQLIVNAARLKESEACGGIKALDGLKSIMEAEEEKRKLSRLRNVSRHSQFSGTFTRLTMDGSKAVYKGNPSSASQNILHKPEKVHRGPAKRIMWDHGTLPSMKDNILELLHDFLNQFLSGGYNVLMESVREDIEKEQNAIQRSDVMVFIQVAHFVTSFQYHKFLNSKPNAENHTSNSVPDTSDSTLLKGNICGPIAATMNESMFVLVISKWRSAFDGLKETNDHKFLSASGSLMKVMIRILDLILKLLPEDSKEPQTTRILLYKLFYDQTDEGMTHFILSQIKSFDTHKQSKSDLADLVETVHVMVRLMEILQGRGTLRVSKKSRRVRKKKKPSGINEAGNELQNEANIQDQNASSHSENFRDLEELPQKGEENATSDNQQETNIAVEVDVLEKSVPETGNLSSHIENSRGLEESPQKSQENATSDTQQAMNIDVEVDAPEKSVPETGNGSTLPQVNNIEHLDDLSCSSDDSSGDEQPAATYEVDFKVSTFVSAFANHSIIRNLCWLLRLYKSNPVCTNHYIVCMLQRISDNLNLAPMLYQLSLLIKFHEILVEQESCPCKEYSNIVDFLTTLVRRMLRKMKNQPLLFVELLFWKSRRECQYINAEYLLHELKGMRKETSTWGNVSTIGEFGSSEVRGWAPRSIGDALGDDEADVVISHDLGFDGMNGSDRDEQRDNASVSNSKDRKAEETGLETERAPKRKKRLVLTDELETRIKELYEKFKDDGNCSKLIAESLDPDGRISSAQVFNKLKQLGLEVASRKRKRHVDRPNSSNLNPKGEKGSELPNSINLEDDFPRESLGKRKRVRAFSKDHEERMKVLFEQFKDHKKCNHMIANALAADNSITAAQVSRKLKQLGLRVPQGKKSQTDVHLRDEVPNDVSVGQQNSDDDVLLSLRNRSPTRAAGRLSDEELLDQRNEGFSVDSDDDLLSNLLHKKKSKTEVHLREEDMNDVSIKEHNSDNEVLSSLRNRKSRKTLLEEKHSSERKAADENSEAPDKVIGFDHFSKQESSKAETSGSTSKSPSHASPVQNPLDQIEDALDDPEDDTSGGTPEQNPLDQTDDALDDSEDDTSGARPEQNPLGQTDDALDDSEDDTSGAMREQNPLDQTDDALDDSEDDTSGAMPDSAIQRRKLRMIIDPDDDE